MARDPATCSLQHNQSCVKFGMLWTATAQGNEHSQSITPEALCTKLQHLYQAAQLPKLLSGLHGILPSAKGRIMTHAACSSAAMLFQNLINFVALQNVGHQGSDCALHNLTLRKSRRQENIASDGWRLPPHSASSTMLEEKTNTQNKRQCT